MITSDVDIVASFLNRRCCGTLRCKKGSSKRLKLKDISVRTDVKNHLINLPMNHQHYELKKRCSACGRQYIIPHIRKSRALDNVIRFAPCPHCGHADKVIYAIQIKRRKWKGFYYCERCRTPFDAEPHYAHGMCKRCYSTMKKQ